MRLCACVVVGRRGRSAFVQNIYRSSYPLIRPYHPLLSSYPLMILFSHPILKDTLIYKRNPTHKVERKSGVFQVRNPDCSLPASPPPRLSASPPAGLLK